MTPTATFPVFNDSIDVLVPSTMSQGALSVIVQHTNPGGGPPPHVHAQEDEIFIALDHGFELFDGSGWKPLPPGQPQFSRRSEVHTFRNAGSKPGKILVLATPGALDEYLHNISDIVMPQDAARLFSISDTYGIRFV